MRSQVSSGFSGFSGFGVQGVGDLPGYDVAVFGVKPRLPFAGFAEAALRALQKVPR